MASYTPYLDGTNILELKKKDMTKAEEKDTEGMTVQGDILTTGLQGAGAI